MHGGCACCCILRCKRYKLAANGPPSKEPLGEGTWSQASFVCDAPWHTCLITCEGLGMGRAGTQEILFVVCGKI